MRGLIEKDIRLTFARKQTLLIFLILAIYMGVAMDGTFIISYFTLLAIIVSSGTISYDEFDNGLSFLMTLPFERKTYVREKYLFTLILAVAGWCFGMIVCLIGGVILHRELFPVGELPEFISLIPLLFLAASIMIPLHLKYGTEKSRIVMFIIFGIIAILVFGKNKVFGDSSAISGIVRIIDGMNPGVVLAIIAGISILAAFASYLWSVRIMEKKEF